MSKKSVNNKAKTDESRINRSSKYFAFLSILTPSDEDNWNNLSITEREILFRLIKGADYVPKNKLEATGLAKLNYADAGYYARYTQSDLADEMHLKRNTISDNLKSLQAKGCIDNRRGIKVGQVAYPAVARIPVEDMAQSYRKRNNDR